MSRSEQRQAAEFIRDETIVSALAYGSRLARDRKKVLAILERARTAKGISADEAAVLLNVEDEVLLEEIYHAASATIALIIASIAAISSRIRIWFGGG